MARLNAELGRAMRDVIRADLIASRASTPAAVARVAEDAVGTLTRELHWISVAPDASVPALLRVTIEGPVVDACIVIEA